MSYFDPGKGGSKQLFINRHDSVAARAGQSVDQIPVGVRFSIHFRTAVGPTQLSMQRIPSHSWVKTAGTWRWQPIPIYRRC